MIRIINTIKFIILLFKVVICAFIMIFSLPFLLCLYFLGSTEVFKDLINLFEKTCFNSSEYIHISKLNDIEYDLTLEMYDIKTKDSKVTTAFDRGRIKVINDVKDKIEKIKDNNPSVV